MGEMNKGNEGKVEIGAETQDQTKPLNNALAL